MANLRDMKKFVSDLISSHSSFLQHKKLNKLDNFYEDVGNNIGKSAQQAKDLLKNLGRDYRTELKSINKSGEARDGELRGSNDFFMLYSEYYDLYHPKGGAVKPQGVRTESGKRKLKSSKFIFNDVILISSLSWHQRGEG